MQEVQAKTIIDLFLEREQLAMASGIEPSCELMHGYGNQLCRLAEDFANTENLLEKDILRRRISRLEEELRWDYRLSTGYHFYKADGKSRCKISFHPLPTYKGKGARGRG